MFNSEYQSKPPSHKVGLSDGSNSVTQCQYSYLVGLDMSVSNCLIQDSPFMLFDWEYILKFLQAASNFRNDCEWQAVVVVDASVVKSGRNLTIVAVSFRIEETGRLLYLSRATFHNMCFSSRLWIVPVYIWRSILIYHVKWFPTLYGISLLELARVTVYAIEISISCVFQIDCAVAACYLCYFTHPTNYKFNMKSSL